MKGTIQRMQRKPFKQPSNTISNKNYFNLDFKVARVGAPLKGL